MPESERKKRGRKPKQQANAEPQQINIAPVDGVVTKPNFIKLKIGKSDIKRIDQQLNQFGQIVGRDQVNTPEAFDQDQQFATIKKHAATVVQDDSNDKSGQGVSNFCDEKEKIISLPTVYEKGVWPEKTNIKCWWCTLSFDNVPCFVPKKMRAGRYHVIGCYCSFNCAMAYNLYSLDQNQHDCLRQCALLHTLYTEIHGETKEILPSPPKETMIMYGGKLTIEEYRKKIKDCSVQSYKLNYPPIVGINFELEHLSKAGAKCVLNPGYVLERSKPPPNDRKKLTHKFIKKIINPT